MRLLLYKTTMKKIYKVTIMVYAIIFIIGYLGGFKYMNIVLNHYICLLYTSDAADEL